MNAEFGAGILSAAVAVKYRVGLQTTAAGGHRDRVADQAGPHVIGHRPADDLTGAAVDHRRQIQPALPGTDVGDVADQLRAREVGGEVPADQILRSAGVGVGLSRAPVGARLAGLQAQLGHDRPDQLG